MINEKENKNYLKKIKNSVLFPVGNLVGYLISNGLGVLIVSIVYMKAAQIILI